MHVNVDTVLVDKMVNEVKSQGVFDQFRKDSMADVDTKPAYQNLRQRVESTVGKFLANQTWRQDLNKNQLREKLRKHITEAGFLDTGVERIVDQVVNPKISSVFQPKIEDIAYKYLGIEKPHSSPPRPQSCNGKIDVKTNFLPTDLEAVSPDSDKTNPKSECKEDIFNDSTEDKNEEFESPPFEPIGPSPVKKEDSNHSHLSGISGLTSQDSASSEHKENQPKFTVNADTQQESVLSEVSSNSRLSIITNDESSSKPTVKESAEVDISEEAQMPKFNDCYNSNESKVLHNLHFDIKREDIKFEGTDRNADKHLYDSDHSNENYAKTEIPAKKFEEIEQSIEHSNIKSEFQIESLSNANIKIESEIKGEDALGDSISNQISSMFEEKNEYTAVDMSCSESDTSQSRNSFRLQYNNSTVDLKSNEIQNGNIVVKPPSPQIAYIPPQPPSPPNEVLSKPPSPLDKIVPINTTLSAKNNFYQRPTSPLNLEASSNYPPAVNDYAVHGPQNPVTDYSSPRPVSSANDYSPPRPPSSVADYLPPRPPSVDDYLPPRPPSPATDYLPPRPPSPEIDCLPPKPPSPEGDCLPPKPPSSLGDCLPPRPPSDASYYLSPAHPPCISDYSPPRPPSPMPRPTSPIANPFASIPSPPPVSDYLASRLPPKIECLASRSGSAVNDYLPPGPPPATEHLAPVPPILASDYLVPRPPPTTDYLAAKPSSPECNTTPPKSPAATDCVALTPPTSSVSDTVGPRSTPITDYIAVRPPLPAYDYLTPKPPVAADDYIAPRSHTPASDYLAPTPPPTVDYLATRPPSPPCDYSAPRPPVTTDCLAPKPPATTDYLAPTPPSPVSVYLIPIPPPKIECIMPRPPSPKTECSPPRPASPVSDYLPPRPPSPVSDYIPPRPPSPPHEDVYRRPPSPVSQKPVFKPPSPVNQDLPFRPRSPPPPPLLKHSYTRPASPSKSKFTADESFPESLTVHNAEILKPPSPPPLPAKSDIMSTKDTSYSESGTPQSTDSSESKNKEISIPPKSDESLKPPSTPSLSKSNSRNESRSKSSSYHHKSKSSSRDDKSSYKSHSHRSSSSSSRNHSSPSSSHHHRSDDKSRSNSSSRHKSSKSDKDKSREKKKDDHTSARHKERRRKSTDSNDGDNHRQRSRHSSHHGDEKSRSMKESTSNSNSSGNFSSNTNSNSGTSCHDASQKKSKSGRSYRNKEQRCSSSRDESLKYFVVNSVEDQETEALLAKLKEAIYAKQSPIYLLDCENDTREMFENASHKVIEIHVTNEYDPAKSSIENRKSRIVAKNDHLKKSDTMEISSMDTTPMLTSENTEAAKNTLKNNLACTISRKRKAEDSYGVSYRMFTGNDKDLIIDCLEYNKTKKIFRPTEDHIEVSPTSSELSVSSKENEFGGTAKKPLSMNTKNGKHIKADGMEKIEKLPNNGFKTSSQRYSSDDLYKPRPLSQRPRRREMIAESPII